jgi:hypothetical protein
MILTPAKIPNFVAPPLLCGQEIVKRVLFQKKKKEESINTAC